MNEVLSLSEAIQSITKLIREKRDKDKAKLFAVGLQTSCPAKLFTLCTLPGIGL